MSYAETIILDWFEITPEKAKQEAADICSLIANHGADSDNISILEKAIYKSLSLRYSWRNVAKKREFEADEKLTIQAYKALINRKG